MTRQNFRRLSNLDIHSPIDIKKIRDAVRKLTSRNKPRVLAGNNDAEQLNGHYAEILRDAAYFVTSKISTTSMHFQEITEYEVFKALDKLKSTKPV